MTGDRPSGTVTFLFTDVEGSTRLWQENPDGMQVALERHDEILRTAIRSHRGYVFSTAGDSFAAAFQSARAAIDASVAIQRDLEREAWPTDAALRVRAGIHTGEAVERDGDYFGTALNRAARVMGLAGGGQILMTGATAELVESARRSEGACELRGLSGRTEVYTVLADGLCQDFEPLRSSVVPSNLPPRGEQIVGRERVLDALVGELGSVRLLSVVGPGGVGKTTVAMELARRVEDSFPAGVWLVELAAVRDPAAVVEALASAVGARAERGGELLDAVLAVLGSGPSLVLLDNCEHLVAASAELATVLLSAASVTIVATSRAPLHLQEEHIWTLSPLQTSGEASAAFRLFVGRARRARHDFELTDGSGEAIRAICALVEGMPLAVELAAARCRAMSPQEVLRRLERDAGRVLRDVRRDVEERQQTLDATISWSYELLTPAERELFARLSIFAGSFDVAGAEAICTGGLVDEVDVIDLLDGLIDQSMVTVLNRSARTRYRMLEPIRQFAEHDHESNDELAARHADYFAQLATEGYEGMWTNEEGEWIARLGADFDNLRLAYQHAADENDLDSALTIAITLNQLGELALQRPAGAEVLFASLELDGAESHKLGAVAMAHASAARGRRRDPAALELAARARELASTPKARWETALWGAIGEFFAGDLDAATASILPAIDLAAEVDEPRALLVTRATAAAFAYTIDDQDHATQLLEGLPSRADSTILQSFLILGHMRYAQVTGEPQVAVDLGLETVDRAREVGNQWAAGNALLGAARPALDVFEPEQVLRLVGDFIPLWRQANDLVRLGWSLLYCAHGLAGVGQHDLAVRLLGNNSSTAPDDLALREELLVLLKAQVGQPTFDDLLRLGNETPIRVLADMALQAIDAQQ